MKIQGTTNNSATAVTNRGGASRTAAPARPASEGDEVRLSAASSELSSPEGVVDGARVQEIRQAIAEGRFQINASAIADRLISTARELVRAQNKG